MYQINSDETLRVIQVTDTHLFGDVGGKLLGVPTFDSMSAVLDRVRDFDFDKYRVTSSPLWRALEHYDLKDFNS